MFVKALILETSDNIVAVSRNIFAIIIDIFVTAKFIRRLQKCKKIAIFQPSLLEVC